MFRFDALKKLRNVLFLGAHSDDIEIGCGGTVLRLIEENPDVSIGWIVFGAKEATRRDEAERAAEKFLAGVKNKHVAFHEFRDAFFPVDYERIKETFERLKQLPPPDAIFTHYGEDAHQDHRTLSQLTWNTFRNHMILEYEIPKYDGDLAQPNVFVPLSDAHVARKVQILMDCFVTQAGRAWFTKDTFCAVARLRGVECQERHAEGFYARKIVC